MIALLQSNTAKRAGANLRRLMIHYGMTQAEVAREAGVDERTVRNILNADREPHFKTLQKLAHAIGVPTHELLRDHDAEAAAFDRDTNEMVRRYVEQRPDLFKNWRQEDIDELASRVAVGGALTVEGVLQVARWMNHARSVVADVKTILETGEGWKLERVVERMYARATAVG